METFLAVAEERSFSRAAARLHRTQPAVSQAIAKLEGELGEVLFERSSRDGTLTDAGEVLREYAAKLLNLRNEAAGALTELRELHRGRLNLAANEYTCLYLLPLLDEFRRQNPRIKLAVQRTLASRISDEVLMHSVELGVLSFRPDDAQVKSMVVYRDELAFVVNPRAGGAEFYCAQYSLTSTAKGDPDIQAAQNPAADGGGAAVAGGDQAVCADGQWRGARAGADGAA
jgi:DNA-binding transcriptional LysR family regulator